MAEDTNIRAVKSLVSWYYTQFLIQPHGLDNNSLWLVTIWPQEGNENQFLKMVETEAARFDLKVNSVGTDGIPAGYHDSNLGKMVRKSWNKNICSMGAFSTNIDGNWGAKNVLMPVVDVTLPTDSIRTKTVDLGPGYTWIPPILADKHEAFKPFVLTMYYSVYPFSEFVIRPWSMAINRWGLKLATLRCNMVLTLFSRVNQWQNPKGRNWVHKFDYRFYGCYPLGVPNLKFDYRDSANDKTVSIQFGYDFYRIDMENGFVAYKALDILNGTPNENLDEAFEDKEIRGGETGDEPPKNIKAGEKDVGNITLDEPYDIESETLKVLNGAEYLFADIDEDEPVETIETAPKIIGDEPNKRSIDIRLNPDGEPPENIDSVRKPMLWLDTPILPITLVFNPKKDDEPTAIGSNDSRPGADEPGRLDANAKGMIGDDEVDGVGENGLGIGTDDEVDALEERPIAVFEGDEPDNIGDRSLLPDEYDEYDGNDANLIGIGDDEPDLHNGKSPSIENDEPDKIGSPIITIDDDEGVGDSIPLIVGEDEPQINPAKAIGVEPDDEPRKNDNRSFRPRNDEPDRLNSRNRRVSGDEPDDFRMGSSDIKNDEVESVPFPKVNDIDKDEVRDVPAIGEDDVIGDESSQSSTAGIDIGVDEPTI